MPYSAKPDNFNGKSNWHLVTERILDAAVRCMSRSGLKVPLREVAEEAGVSRGVLYRHVAGRDALIEAVLERTVDRALEAASREVEQHPALSEQVAAVIRLMPGSRGEPLATVLAAQPAEREEWLLARWRAFWVPRLAGAMARGEVRADATVTDAADWISRAQLSFGYKLPEDLAAPGTLDRYVDEQLMRGLNPV